MLMTAFKQLPLGIALPEKVSLANFVTGDNRPVLELIKHICSGDSHEQHLYLYGKKGVGRSHLLQAACQLAADNGWATAYLPLKQAWQFEVEWLTNMQDLRLICIDDVQAITGQPQWEQALFYLYQYVLESKTYVIWTADVPPTHLALQLADLRSRLAASLVLPVLPLNDADKLHALQQHAAQRGLVLSASVGNYLLAHYSRQMQDLVSMLDKLDCAALIAQRALTIPFVKQVLVDG